MEEVANFKIKVNNKEEFEEITKILQRLGFKWAYGENRINYYKQLGYVYFYSFSRKTCGMDMGITHGSGNIYFQQHPNKKITLRELRAKDFPKKLNKAKILNNLQ